MKTWADFSSDRKYRYALGRTWDETKPVVAFCMLNPSTADEVENDPTVERCQRRAKQWGYGGFVVVNLFAYRSTDPKLLRKVKDPIGPSNNLKIAYYVQTCDMLICAWGKYGKFLKRDEEVLKQMSWLLTDKSIYALKLNKDGSPAHPLYIGYSVKPFNLVTGEKFKLAQ